MASGDAIGTLPSSRSDVQQAITESRSFGSCRPSHMSPRDLSCLFSLGVPGDGISAAEIKVILNMCDNNKEDLLKYLLELAKQKTPYSETGLLELYLDRLEGYIRKGTELKQVKTLTEILILNGDRLALLSDDDKTWSEERTLRAILRLLSAAYERFGNTERGFFLAALEQSNSPVVLLRTALMLRESFNETLDFQSLALEKIRSYARDGSLINIPQLVMFLHFWMRWGKDDELNDWAQKASIDDENFLKLLIATRNRTTTADQFGEITVEHGISFDFFDRFLPREHLMDRAQKLLSSDIELSDDEREALEKTVRNRR